MIEPPAWLSRRGGAFQKGHAGNSWFVILNNQPLYRLTSIPVGDQFGCAITQTNNGKRIPSTTQARTPEEALKAGLSDLGKALGWEG